MSEPQFNLKAVQSLIRDKNEAGLPVKLHLGCGTNYFEGWFNIDNDSDQNIEKYDLELDLSQGLPLADSCADFIYNEHFLEHLEPEAAVKLLRACLRVLKPGGILRLAMPDLDRVVEYYHDPDWREAPGLKDADLSHVKTRAELLNINCHWWGRKWLYNFEELERRLREAGTVRLERCAWGRSRHRHLRDLETRPPESSALIVEAVKPGPRPAGAGLAAAVQAGADVAPAYRLTILSTTYNHAPYLAQALDSLLAQKTKFPFQILVADDCSTDGTTDILRAYAARCPEIIKAVFREKNLGPVINGVDLLQRVETEYVAICEGDDFWLDPLKLQKQVDFLESNPGCALCFHPVRVIYEGDSRPDEVFPTPDYRFNRTRLILDDLLKHNFIQTNSVVFRWRFRNGLKYSDLIPGDILPQDYYLHLIHSETGEIGFLDEVMSAYRRHAGALWSRTRDDKFLQVYGPALINFYLNVERRFQVDKSAHLAILIQDIARSYLKVKNYQGLLDMAEKAPGALSQALVRLLGESAGNGAGEGPLLMASLAEFYLYAPEAWRQIIPPLGLFRYRGLTLGARHIRLMGGLYIRLALLAQKLLGGNIGDRLIKALARHYAAGLACRGSFKKLGALAARHPRLFETPGQN